jgi:hypothetical protein
MEPESNSGFELVAHGESSFFSPELDFLRLILLGRRVRSVFMM